ncbi:MAG: hypothetical protein LBQ40_01115 [Clostridiales bacterium]|jgi:hypothetical protein|nr:hypothetical protein [Clostridiales bacterium]
MDGHLIRIRNDLYDIASRLREIDVGYYPVYNRRKSRFEVYHETDESAPACIPPFGALDGRTVDYVLKTRRENAKALLAEIERTNCAAESRRERELIDRAQKKAGYLVDYLGRGGEEIPRFGQL